MITEGSDGWVFTKPDGQPCQTWVSDQQLAWHLDFALRKQQKVESNQLARVDSFQHPRGNQHSAPLGRRTLRPTRLGPSALHHQAARADAGP
jgi:hypothetical protein